MKFLTKHILTPTIIEYLVMKFTFLAENILTTTNINIIRK